MLEGCSEWQGTGLVSLRLISAYGGSAGSGRLGGKTAHIIKINFGGMPEWFKGTVLKTVVAKYYREFESHSLRFLTGSQKTAAAERLP